MQMKTWCLTRILRHCQKDRHDSASGRWACLRPGDDQIGGGGRAATYRILVPELQLTAVDQSGGQCCVELHTLALLLRQVPRCHQKEGDPVRASDIER